MLSMVKYLPVLFGIGLVIFFHELGHYIAATLMKVDVEVLSFGYGPKLFSIQGKKTEFRISCIPFGGYCKLKGSLDLIKALKDESRSITISEEGSYFSTTPVVRFFIYLAGPLMNFILAILLITISALIPVERISNPAIVTPAYLYSDIFGDVPIQNSILKGDLVERSGNKPILDYQDLEKYLIENEGKMLPLTVIRDGKEVDIVLSPLKLNDEEYTFGITNLQEPIIGRSNNPVILAGDRVLMANGKKIDYTLDLYSLNTPNLELVMQRGDSTYTVEIEDGKLPFAWKSDLRKYRANINYITYGVSRASDLFVTTLKTLGALLTLRIDDARAVITGPMKAASKFNQISTIAFQTSTESGARTILYLLAIVSISICVGNVLPIPTFDGGQMLINVVEMIKRKPLSPKSYLSLQAGGMIIGWLIVISMYAFDIKNQLLH